MAKIVKYDDYEEFFAKFIAVGGERGTVLVFVDEGDEAEKLAADIAVVIDRPSKPWPK